MRPGVDELLGIHLLHRAMACDVSAGACCWMALDRWVYLEVMGGLEKCRHEGRASHASMKTGVSLQRRSGVVRSFKPFGLCRRENRQQLLGLV